MRLVHNYNRNIIHIGESQFSADPKIISEEIISTLLPSVASEVTQAVLIPRVLTLPICCLIIASRGMITVTVLEHGKESPLVSCSDDLE